MKVLFSGDTYEGVERRGLRPHPIRVVLWYWCYWGWEARRKGDSKRGQCSPAEVDKGDEASYRYQSKS